MEAPWQLYRCIAGGEVIKELLRTEGRRHDDEVESGTWFRFQDVPNAFERCVDQRSDVGSGELLVPAGAVADSFANARAKLGGDTLRQAFS